MITPYLPLSDGNFIERWFNLRVSAASSIGDDSDTIRVQPPLIRRPKESSSEGEGSSSSEEDQGGSDYEVGMELTQRSSTSTRGRPPTRGSRVDKTNSTPTKGKEKENPLPDDERERFDPSRHKKWLVSVCHSYLRPFPQ